MAPRPRPSPDDSLFAEERPYLQGRRRSSGLMLSGLETDLSCLERNDSWDDELAGGASIELTCSSSGSSGGGSLHQGELDPLVLGGHQPKLSTNTNHQGNDQFEDEACANDAEIAALMAAEWNAEVRKQAAAAKRKKLQQQKQKLPQAPEPLSPQQTMLVYVWLALVVAGILGLGVYSILFGLGGGDDNSSSDGAVASSGSGRSNPHCPKLDLPSVEQLSSEQAAGDNTSVCRRRHKDCTCQNPTSSSHFLLDSFSASKKLFDQTVAKETATLSGFAEETLDVVFVGQFSSKTLDEDDNSIWASHQIQKAHIATEDDIRSSNILYRFETEGVIPSEVKPKVWWISLGEQDLLVDGCSLDAVQMGTYHLVQSILGRSDMNAKIVISPPPPPSDNNNNKDPILLGLLNHWNDRLKCIANMNSQVDYYDPYKTVAKQEDDDDFFTNVGGGGSSSSSSSETTSSARASEEVQQAILDKLVELIH